MVIVSEILAVTVSLVLLWTSSLFFGRIFSFIKLPMVIGEILSGVVIGPFVFGHMYPEAYAWIFNGFPEQKTIFSLFSWIGLMLLMLSLGFQIKIQLRNEVLPQYFSLIVGALLVPFIFGCYFATYIHKHAGANFIAFSLVIGIATAITSIPVLYRIFEELKIKHTVFAQKIMVVSSIINLFLWIILSVALVIQREGAGNVSLALIILYEILKLMAYGIFLLSFTPLLIKYIEKFFIRKSDLTIGFLIITLSYMLLGLALQIKILYSALLMGIAFARIKGNVFDGSKKFIDYIAENIFSPIYFSITGMAISFTGDFSADLIFSFIFLSSIIRIIGVYICLAGNHKALDYGVTLNARGGPGIILAGIGYEAKILDADMFITLIISSIVTSVGAGLWLRHRIDKYV